MRPATIIGWTGKGKLSDLSESAHGSLVAGQIRGVRLRRVGGSLICGGVDPVVVSRAVGSLPGVSWVALGYEVSNGLEEFTKTAAALARRYLSRGTTFTVSATTAKPSNSEGDMILAVSSAILAAVKGTRVEEKKPKIRFRISFAGSVGACGVQIREGVGGVPTSKTRIAYCLVSGGRHSSAAAWVAALAGFSLGLVHVRVGDEPLRQVAKLYSELSYRMDPSRLSLAVVEGRGRTAQTLNSWLRDSRRIPVIVGTHLECLGGEVLNHASNLPPTTLLPVLLVQEEEVKAIYQDLGMKENEVPTRILTAEPGRAVKYVVKQFKGARADMHAVLDSIIN